MRQGPDGALYLLTDNAKGRILKLVPEVLADQSSLLALGCSIGGGSKDAPPSKSDALKS